jgi:tetrachlorobenzoquinone reductase
MLDQAVAGGMARGYGTRLQRTEIADGRHPESAGDRVHRNAYSLLNAGYGEGLAYFIAVQRARDSKGGSIYMHEQVERGCELTISVPANNFAVADSAT